MGSKDESNAAFKLWNVILNHKQHGIINIHSLPSLHAKEIVILSESSLYSLLCWDDASVKSELARLFKDCLLSLKGESPPRSESSELIKNED